MNIGERLKASPVVIPVFTWSWFCGSVVASAYFAFFLFPAIYEHRTSAIVEVHFQTIAIDDDGGRYLMYYPNTETQRQVHLASISDRSFLYYSACEALPLSQRPICDTARNWKKLDPKDLGCSSAMDCDKRTHRLSEEERYVVMAGTRPLEGASVSIDDLKPVSLADPVGWGEGAKWPLFFVSLFLAMKLGGAVGEFAFTPYVK